MEGYAVLILVWLVGIPVALGITLKGWWPQTYHEFVYSRVLPWIYAFLWPLSLAVMWLYFLVDGLWFTVVLFAKLLFRLGSWFR